MLTCVRDQEGLAGIRGWRWIFIIEGILTCVISLGACALLVHFPDRALNKKYWRFLSQREIAFIIRRINSDRNDADDQPWNSRAWASSGLDLKIWGFALCLL